MEEKVKEMSTAERACRLDEVQYRLYAISKMREMILEQHQSQDNGMDLYVEANEILNEVEKRIWDFVTGATDEY